MPIRRKFRMNPMRRGKSMRLGLMLVNHTLQTSAFRECSVCRERGGLVHWDIQKVIGGHTLLVAIIGVQSVRMWVVGGGLWVPLVDLKHDHRDVHADRTNRSSTTSESSVADHRIVTKTERKFKTDGEVTGTWSQLHATPTRFCRETDIVGKT